jgi:ABC-type multidrug transport system fused ATPase/permease subunit
VCQDPHLRQSSPAPPRRPAQQARSLGFDEVIDLSVEKLSDGVRRITEGYGTDIVIDAMGGEILSEALGTLSIGGSLTTLGYAAGRKTTIDVTDLIWKRARMKSFSLFSQPAEVWTTAWNVIFPLLQSGAVKPIVAKTFPLAEAADALRYLVDHLPATAYRGTLGVTRTDRFSAQDISFLKQVAGPVAIAIENATAHGRIAELTDKLAREKVYFEDEIRSELNFQEIIGKSEALRTVFQQVETVAPTDSTVLICGETGTGKELIARAIHDLSSRAKNVRP